MISEGIKNGNVLGSTSFNTFSLSFGVCVCYTLAVKDKKRMFWMFSLGVVWLVLMGGSVGGEVIEYEAEQLTRLEYMEGETGYYKESVKTESVNQQCDANNCLISGENDISWDMITGSRLNTVIQGPSSVTGSISISIRIMNLTVSRGVIVEYVHPEAKLGAGFGNTLDGSTSYDAIKNHYADQTTWYDSAGVLIENFTPSKYDWSKAWKRVSEYCTKNLNDIRECGSWTDNNLCFASIHAVIPQFKGVAVGRFDEDDYNEGLFGVSIGGGTEQLVTYEELVIGKDMGNGVTLKLYQEPVLNGPSGRGCFFYSLNGPYVEFTHSGFCNPVTLGSPAKSGIGMVQSAYVPNSENLTPSTLFYGREIPNEVIWQRGSNPQETGTMTPGFDYYSMARSRKDPKFLAFLAAWTVKKVVKVAVAVVVLGAVSTTTALWADAQDEWCEAIMYSETPIENLMETVTPFNATEGEKQFFMSKSTTIINNQFGVIRGSYSNVRGTGVLKVMCSDCVLEIEAGVVEVTELVVSECVIYQSTGSGSCKIIVTAIGTGGNIPLTSNAQLLESFMYIETGTTTKVVGVLVAEISSAEIEICTGQTCDSAPVKYDLGVDGGGQNELNPDSVKPSWTGGFNDLCHANTWFCVTYSLVCVGSILIFFLAVWSLWRLMRDRKKVKFSNTWSTSGKTALVTMVYCMGLMSKSVGGQFVWAPGSEQCGEPSLNGLLKAPFTGGVLIKNVCTLEMSSIVDLGGILYGIGGPPIGFSDPLCGAPAEEAKVRVCTMMENGDVECSNEMITLAWCLQIGEIDGSLCYVRGGPSGNNSADEQAVNSEGLEKESEDGNEGRVTSCIGVTTGVKYYTSEVTQIGGCAGLDFQVGGGAHKSSWPLISGGLYRNNDNETNGNPHMIVSSNVVRYSGGSYCYPRDFVVTGVANTRVECNDTISSGSGLYPNTSVPLHRVGSTLMRHAKLTARAGSLMTTKERAFYFRLSEDGDNIITENIVGLCKTEDNMYWFVCVKERKFKWGTVIEVSGHRRVKKGTKGLFHVFNVVAIDGAESVEYEVCNKFGLNTISGAKMSSLGRTWWVVTCIEKGSELCEYKSPNDACGSESRSRMNVGGLRADVSRDLAVEKSLKRSGKTNIVTAYNVTDSMYFSGVVYSASLGGPICAECFGIDPIYGGRCNSSVVEVWISSAPTMYENTLEGETVNVQKRLCFGVKLGNVKCEGKLTDKGGIITAASGCALLSQDGWKTFKIVKAGEDARLKSGTVSYWHKGRMENDNVKMSDPSHCWGGMSVAQCWNCVYYEFKTAFWVPLGLAIGFLSIVIVLSIWGILSANWARRGLSAAKRGTMYVQGKVQNGMEWLSGKVGRTLLSMLEDARSTVERLSAEGKLSTVETADAADAYRSYNRTMTLMGNKSNDPSRVKSDLVSSTHKYTSIIMSYKLSKAGKKMDAASKKIMSEFTTKYGENAEVINAAEQQVLDEIKSED